MNSIDEEERGEPRRFLRLMPRLKTKRCPNCGALIIGRDFCDPTCCTEYYGD